MIGTTPGVIKVPKGAVFIRVKPIQTFPYFYLQISIHFTSLFVVYYSQYSTISFSFQFLIFNKLFHFLISFLLIHLFPSSEHPFFSMFSISSCFFFRFSSFTFSVSFSSLSSCISSSLLLLLLYKIRYYLNPVIAGT